jgi:hypothetical protein
MYEIKQLLYMQQKLQEFFIPVASHENSSSFGVTKTLTCDAYLNL